jgi:hypothetical protein
LLNGKLARPNVLNTYRVWLIYEIFRGGMTPRELVSSEAQIRVFVSSRKTINSHLSNAVGLDTLTKENLNLDGRSAAG